MLFTIQPVIGKVDAEVIANGFKVVNTPVSEPDIFTQIFDAILSNTYGLMTVVIMIAVVFILIIKKDYKFYSALFEDYIKDYVKHRFDGESVDAIVDKVVAALNEFMVDQQEQDKHSGRVVKFTKLAIRIFNSRLFRSLIKTKVNQKLKKMD